MPVFENTRWWDNNETASGSIVGFDGMNGGPGGVVTWSIVGPGWSNQTLDPNFINGQTVDFSSVTPPNYEDILRDAFEAWSSYGNIDFIQIEDQGGDLGVGEHATIRIGAGPIDGAGSIYAHAFPPLPGMGGDIMFDSGDFLNLQLLDFNFMRIVATHEIGHTLGLGHISGSVAFAIMNPGLNLSGGFNLKQDDITGIQALYGIQDNAPSTYYMPISMNDISIRNGLNDLTIKGNALDNKIDTSFIVNGAMVKGGEGTDELITGRGADELDGGTGVDTLAGGFGNDIYYVDEKNDRVIEKIDAGTDQVWSTSDITILADNVEQLKFTDGDNHIGRGNDLSNLLYGNDGIDHFLWDGQGNDIYSGGNSLDIFDARKAGQGVHLDLMDQNNHAGAVVGDSFASIETFFGSLSEENTMIAGMGRARFVGGNETDDLTGGDTIDLLIGGEGNDVLSGGSASDALIGGADDDTLTGGEGRDQFRFIMTDFGDDTITDFEDGIDLLRFHSAAASSILDFSIQDNGSSQVELSLITDGFSGTLTVQGLNGNSIFIDQNDILFY